MAENKRPLIAVDNPSHINFATIKDRTVSRNNNKSPMASDRHYNAGGRIDAGADHLSVLVDTARMQLISPPPEEILRKNQVRIFLFCFILRGADYAPSCSDSVFSLRLHYWQMLARRRLTLLHMARLLQRRGKEPSLHPPLPRLRTQGVRTR